MNTQPFSQTGLKYRNKYLVNLQNIYVHSTDSFGKTVILSLIDHKKYTINFINVITNIFNSSKYLIKKLVYGNYTLWEMNFQLKIK